MRRSSDGLGRNSPGICYVILTFNDVTQLCYCLWSVWNPANTYVLLVDVKSGPACRFLCEELSATFENIIYMYGHNGSWGGYSLVAASLSGIRTALSCSPDWQHLCLISGNHVARQDQAEISSGLEVGKSYLRSERVETGPRPSDATFLNHTGIQRRLWGWFEEIPGVKSVTTGIRSELPDVDFFKGSQWVTLSRAACEVLTGPTARELTNFFAHSFVPDETFFHTTVRALEKPENIVSADTTYHRWSGGRAADLSEGDYARAAAESGKWFARKLPSEIGRSYSKMIQSSCHALDLENFVALFAGRSSDRATIRLSETGIAVTGAQLLDHSALLHSNFEKLIFVLQELAGSHAIIREIGGQVLNLRIEPPATAPGSSPVAGVVRSADGKTAWLTIQLRAELFSASIAARLRSSNDLRGVVDDTFEETHLEPEFREFFQRSFRTGYVFDLNQIERPKAHSRLTTYFKLLTEAWASLGPLQGQSSCLR